MIDILGYNDRWVARLPSAVLDRRDWRRYVPGHVKWDQHRLLGEQRPDAFFQIWGTRRLGRVREIMPAEGYRYLQHFWVRADSPFVHSAGSTWRCRRQRTAAWLYHSQWPWLELRTQHDRLG
jgi:hypothetical protein